MPFNTKEFMSPDLFPALKDDYRAKNELLSGTYSQMPAAEFYRDLIPHTLEPEGQDCNVSTGVGNLMCVYQSDDKKMHTRIITEDTRDHLEEMYGNNRCALIPPVTFYGRTAKAVNARYIFALTIDLDQVRYKHLVFLLSEFFVVKLYPVPNYVINSGTGLHIYYLFNEPVPAYPAARTALTNLKRALTKLEWSFYSSQINPTQWWNDKVIDNRQYHSCVQGFRVVGSLSKLGPGYPVTAFKLSDKKWEPEDLNEYIKKVDESAIITPDKLKYKSEIRLDKAKELFPQWYEKRIVNKEPRKKTKISPKLYEMFLKKIKEDVTFGHRYFCVGMLAVYAIKCDIDKKRLIDDVLEIQPMFSALVPDYPFTREEALKAVDSFYKPENFTFTIKHINALSAIIMPITRRNGRTQQTHIKIISAVRDALHPDGEWRNKNGAPTKAQIVAEWRKKHRNGTKAQCARATGLSKPTVLKWWGIDTPAPETA